MGIKPLTKAPIVSEAMDVYGLASTLLLAIVGPAYAPGSRLLAPEMAEKGLDEVWQDIEAAQLGREREPIAPKAVPKVKGGARRQLIAAFRRWFARDPRERPTAATMTSELRVLLAYRAQADRRRRMVSRVAFGAVATLLLGAPAAYAGGRYAITEQECQAKIAADAQQTGEISTDLKGCQAQAKSLIATSKDCSASLVQTKTSLDTMEKELTGKLSGCTNADASLKALLAGCQMDRTTALGKAKDCAASLTQSNASLALTSASLAQSNAALTQSNAVLAQSNATANACGAAESAVQQNLAKCNSNQLKCTADLTRCDTDGSECASKLTSCNTTLQSSQSDLASCKANGAAGGACSSQLAICESNLVQCRKIKKL